MNFSILNLAAEILEEASSNESLVLNVGSSGISPNNLSPKDATTNFGGVPKGDLNRFEASDTGCALEADFARDSTLVETAFR